MLTSCRLPVAIATFVTLSVLVTAQQPVDPASAIHWRQIGPTRAGRACAVAGVASQLNAIGAIAVAPSNPSIIYVGSGAGIIRPDLSTGDGLYKSTDTSAWAIGPAACGRRLTGGDRVHTQPLTLRMDPRVKIPAMDMALLNRLTKEMYDGAVAARTAYTKTRALVTQLNTLGGNGIAEFKAKVEALAPAAAAGGGGPGRGGGAGRGGGPGGPGGGAAAAPTLQSVSGSMLAAAMAMQAAEMAPTLREVTATNAARTQSVAVMARWTALTTTELTALNARRRSAGLPVITIGK